MNVQLLPYSRQDIQDLSMIAMKSYREHYLYLWQTEAYAQWYMDRSFSIPSLEVQMDDPGSSFYRVVYQDHTCGFIKINWNKALRQEENSMELERIYLLHAFSGKGIGTSVMQWIMGMAKQKGKEMIWLKSMDSSRSLRFYSNAGFRKTGTERLPFEGFRDEYRNMWVMEKEID